MQITINGQAHSFEKTLSVRQILETLNIDESHGVAVALNDTVIGKAQLSESIVEDGDTLEIIQATAGG